tara:strand:- start:86 stop:448 length:363 start_codon:yes stop_codon:yes gene_type:complete
MSEESFKIKCAKIAGRVVNLLGEKNAQYGDSAFDPIRFFSDLPPDAGLRVRIDDKLSRLMRGSDTIESDIDVIEDLIGYFILLRLTMDDEKTDEVYKDSGLDKLKPRYHVPQRNKFGKDC